MAKSSQKKKFASNNNKKVNDSPEFKVAITAFFEYAKVRDKCQAIRLRYLENSYPIIKKDYETIKKQLPKLTDKEEIKLAKSYLKQTERCLKGMGKNIKLLKYLLN
jgi:hypothetical protein